MTVLRPQFVLSVSFVAALCAPKATAFSPPRPLSTVSINAKRTNEPSISSLFASGPPVISNWRYSPATNTISGTVTNHPTIKDGDSITTSPVRNVNDVDENSVMQTQSGSKYKLGSVAWGATVPAKAQREKEAAAAKAAAAKRTQEEKEAKERQRAANEKSKVDAAKKKSAVNGAKTASRSLFSFGSSPAPAPKPAAPAAVKQPQKTVDQPKQISPNELKRLAKSAFSLTGTTVGPRGEPAKYLLAGKPRQSSGRAAKIWTAYMADPSMEGVPLGFTGNDSDSIPSYTIKLSPDTDRMNLENTNYNKVQSGLFPGRFVKKMDYIPVVSSSDRRTLDGKVAGLVIESGQLDLKALLNARGGRPLQGRALRDAAAAAGQCIQAVHSSNLVWTDLKTENFIVVGNDNLSNEISDGNGSLGLQGVKGIDLESVIRRGGNPIDYSPEACPPEFAKAYMAGDGADFVLDYSYDMWSLGMMLYEISTGTAYFERKSPSQVTKLLCDESFEADVDDVPDGRLRDLIGKCLSLEPGKRPDITGFLLHPYFITTGIGPISF